MPLPDGISFEIVNCDEMKGFTLIQNLGKILPTMWWNIIYLIIIINNAFSWQ